jgi:transcriptional regulator of heat shock response
VLSQPEFYEFEKLQNLSLVFDNLESICESLFENVKNTEISIGVEGSFSENLSSIKSRFSHGVITIIGPTRMDYKQNLALINYFKNKIGD